jgi:hypothetical protein
MREGKKKKGSAIVVMTTQEGAQKAAAADKEGLKNLAVVVVGRVAPVASTDARQTAAPLTDSGNIGEKHEASTNNAEKPKNSLSSSRPDRPLFPAAAKQVPPKKRSSEFASFVSFKKS